MDINRILAELHLELERLDAAILSLERLQVEGRRRGRPPKILARMKSSVRSGEDISPDADLLKKERRRP